MQKYILHIYTKELHIIRNTLLNNLELGGVFSTTSKCFENVIHEFRSVENIGLCI